MATVPGINAFFTISGRFEAVVGSQVVPLSGAVTFTPTVEALLMAATTPPLTGLPETVTAFLDADGDLSTFEAGVPVKHVTLFPNNDPAANPSTGWNYTVSFDFTDSQGRKVKRTGFNIDAPAGGVADLTQVSQVTPGTGTPITVGPPNTLAVGTVTTGAPGSGAVAAIHGAAPNQTLDLTVPRGDVGATGPANVLTLGTVTTGAPGAPATASIVGDAPAQTLNLGLPQGATGPATNLTVLGTTTGPSAAGTPGPQGLPGAKGDPGGITYGTDLSTNDLNTITTPGVYRQSNGANSTLAAHYPAVNAIGALVVFAAWADTSRIEQEFRPIVSGESSRVVYKRTLYSNVWTAWHAYNSTRTDQTAGRAIYQWDDLNAREQLIYGDTGTRFVDAWVNSALFDNTGTQRTITARRVGNVVSMSGQMLSTAAVPIGSTLFTLPPGFKQDRMLECIGLHTAASTPARIVVGNSGNVAAFYTYGNAALSFAAGQILQFSFTFTTVDAWPTVLPGTASGSIPNV